MSLSRPVFQPSGRRRGWVRGVLLAAASAGLLLGVVSRAGMTHRTFQRSAPGSTGPRTVLRVWDWWAPTTSEKYTSYFGEVEREFERLHPEVDVVFQFVPFEQYEQKMATGLVGASPPDVFQSSVVWAEGFYDRGMLLPLNGYLERDRRERDRREAAGETVDRTQIVDREAFLEPAWRHNTKAEGTVYGIPQILDADALTWNLDLLKREADDPDVREMFLRRPDGTPDYTRLRWDGVRDWEHLRRVFRRLTRRDASGAPKVDPGGEEVQVGFSIHAHGSDGGAAPVLPWIAANGGEFQDPAGTRARFAEPAGIEAMQLLLDLYWKDRVTPRFRRQLSDDDVFNGGKVACISSGTYAGKYIVRNTEGRLHFDQTAYPPGPHGRGAASLAWGNVLVISRRCPNPDLAWEYVKFITSLPGQLRLLRLVDLNSPRKDFYDTPAWRQQCAERPYLTNIPAICASGKKLRHTQINAINHATASYFESLLLRYPEIQRGNGPYASVEAGLREAAAAADRVYRRYQAQVAYWHQQSQNRDRKGAAQNSSQPTATP